MTVSTQTPAYTVTDDVDGTTTASIESPNVRPPGWVQIQMVYWDPVNGPTNSQMDISPTNNANFVSTQAIAAVAAAAPVSASPANPAQPEPAST